MRAHPEFDRDYIVASAKTIDRVVWDSTTRSKGLGMLDRSQDGRNDRPYGKVLDASEKTCAGRDLHQ